MKIHRIVTARDAEGKSVFLSSGAAPRTHDFVHIPGAAQTQIWATPAVPSLDGSVSDPTLELTSLVPPPGETRFAIVAFPPDSLMMGGDFDALAAAEEGQRASPGLAELFESDNPGMHTTNTVDYGVVLEGEIWLELDEGRVQHLRKHDVVVQNGTRHAWRNKSEQNALIAFVMIGARRS